MFLHRVALVVAGGVAALALAGCGDVSLTSAYRSEPVTVDGNYKDWHGQMKFIEKINLSVGAMNDEDSLYVVVVVGDQETQRLILRDGLFLWFDPAGGTDHEFCVHYPIGILPGGEWGERGERGAGLGDNERRRRRDPALLEKKSLAEVELIGAGGASRITREPDDLPGVEVAARHERGGFTIEYRIPLTATADSPYGVGAVPGQVIGVGLMTPARKRPAVERPMDDERRPPGAEGEGGEEGEGELGERPGVGRGGMRAGGGFAELPEPIDLWATLTLATVPH